MKFCNMNSMFSLIPMLLVEMRSYGIFFICNCNKNTLNQVFTSDVIPFHALLGILLACMLYGLFSDVLNKCNILNNLK
jgi:uncharacterized membrane protein (DUF106 family)